MKLKYNIAKPGKRVREGGERNLKNSVPGEGPPTYCNGNQRTTRVDTVEFQGGTASPTGKLSRWTSRGLGKSLWCTIKLEPEWESRISGLNITTVVSEPL